MPRTGRPKLGTEKVSPTKVALAAVGFIPATDAARAIGHHVSNLYRWIDDGKVASGAAHGKPRYAEVRSLRAHLATEKYGAELDKLDAALPGMGVPAEHFA